VSSYNGALFAEATRVVERERLTRITIHQPYYNMLTRGVEWDLLPQTELAGCGVIAFCPLASGLLTSKYLNGIPENSRAAERWGKTWVENALTPAKLETLRQLDELARARGQSLAQMALAWLLRLPGVTSALIGASSVRQIEENVAALQNLGFNDDELKQIEHLCPRM
jgi:L-glyceraldehyde 3-phosphate reductase